MAIPKRVLWFCLHLCIVSWSIEGHEVLLLSAGFFFVVEDVEFCFAKDAVYWQVCACLCDYAVVFFVAESGFGDDEVGDGGLEGIGLLTPRNLFA